MEREDRPIVNPLALKQRSFEQVLRFLAEKCPDYTFGVFYSKGKWVAQAQAPNGEPVSIEDDNFAMAITLALGEARSRA